ncbi:MAG: hypothetical protein ACM30G_15820 [Micromonosporaceae bacterium]
MRRRRLVWIVVMVSGLVGLGGCGGQGSQGAGSDDRERLQEQARQALARYDQALLDAGGPPRFTPVGELTGQLGDWEMTNGDNKAALMSGRVIAATALPAAPQPNGDVVWAAGTTRAFPLISAEEALRQLVAAGVGECGGCAPLQVTGARLSTVEMNTTRGPATVPAWEFTLTGTTVRITRVAVAESATVRVTPPSWDPYHPPAGLAIESATTNSAGRRLTVTFTGSPGPASQPCGADYRAEAVESANAVVVIVVEERHAGGEGACPAIGAIRTATVDLAQPLADRAVLEVQQGLPVPVTITP